MTDAGRKVQLGIKKNALRKYEKTPREPMRFRRMPTISSVSTADSGGAWIWDLGRTSESERFCFKKEPFRSAWSLFLLKSKCRHVTYSHSFFMCRDHSDGNIMAILTLATKNLPVKNTFIDLDIGTGAQLESAFKHSMNFNISRNLVFRVVSWSFRKMVVDCGCSKAYRDLKAVILKVFGSLAGPVGQELQQGANLQATPEDGHFFNCSLVKRQKRMTPNRIPSHQHWTSFCQFSVPKVCTFTSHMSSYVIHWAHRWRLRTCVM